MTVTRSLNPEKTTAELQAEVTELRRQVATLQATLTANQQEKESLAAKSRSYQFIANTSPDFMTLINREHRYEAANLAYCQAHQKSPAEIIGKSVAEVWGEERYQVKVKEHLDLCLAGQEVRYQSWFEFATLGQRYFDVIYSPYYDEAGVVSHAVVVSRDNTLYKRIEEQLRRSEQRYRLVSDLTSNFTYAFAVGPDDEFLLEWVTDAFSRITGYMPEEVNRRSRWTQLTHPDDLFLVDRREQALFSGQMNVTEFRIITKSGEIRWLRDHIRPIWSRKQKRVVRFFGAVQDITERKRAEAERERFANQLRTAAEISQVLTAVLKPDQLLAEIVSLLQSRFNLYHVHVYLLDAGTGYLVMKAGSGETGRILQERGHKLSLNQTQSLVVRAARQQELMVLNDASQTSAVLRKSLLPHSRTEVAIPLIVGEELLGVLDIQDDQVNHFDQTDINTFKILAGQIAIAIRNARLVESLQLSEARYELAASVGKVGVWDWDLKTDTLYLAPNLKAMLGYEDREISNVPADWNKHIYPDDAAMVRAKTEAHLAGETPHLSLEYRMLHQDGSLRWMLSRGKALPDEQGRPRRLTGANTEITELKQVQEALLYRIGLEEFVTTMSTRFINLPTDQIDAEISNALDIIGKFFGVDCGFIATSGDTETRPKWQILCSWRTEAISPKLQVGLEVPVNEFEWSLNQIRQYDCLYIPHVSGLPAAAQPDQAFFQSLGLEAILALPMYLNESIFGMVGLATARDQKNWSSDTIAPLKLVSQMFVNALERKRVEEQVQASLQEKEVLLKEIHHRVKNNLQVISSLLYLQASYIDDERVQDIFRESQSRIKSMALIHENLYQTENLTRIDLAGYISNLVDYLLQVYVINPASVKVRLDIAEVELDIDMMIPCGLVITELITNALKYAYPQTAARAINEPPEIWVNLREEPAGRIALIIGNNGTGLPADLNLEQANTLGLKLVTRLVKQLDGSLELDLSQGVVFKISFSSGKVI